MRRYRGQAVAAAMVFLLAAFLAGCCKNDDGSKNSLSLLGGLPGGNESPVGLGSLSGFRVLASSTVANTGPTSVDGDVGVWAGSSVTGFPPGTLTGLGDSNAVFIFQIPSSLTVTTGRRVILAGGAQASNVFWQVGSSATLGTNSFFVGTIMAQASITLQTGASLEGRALARTGGVTLDTSVVF